MKNALVILLAALLVSLTPTAFGVRGDAEAADARQLAIAVGDVLAQGHYAQWKLDASMSGRILEAYLGILDPEKLFFTQEDVEQLSNRYGHGLGDDVRLGDLGPARDIFQLFKRRVHERLEKIPQALGQPHAFENNRTVPVDRGREPWPNGAGKFTPGTGLRAWPRAKRRLSMPRA